MVKYAFILMTSTRWIFTFLFPVVLNNIVLIDCASAKAKLLKALKLYHIFVLFSALKQNKKELLFLTTKGICIKQKKLR